MLGLKLLPVPQNSLQAFRLQNFLAGKRSLKHEVFLRIRIDWPAQHDWLLRYFVFEGASLALEEFTADGMPLYFNNLQR